MRLYNKKLSIVALMGKTKQRVSDDIDTKNREPSLQMEVFVLQAFWLSIAEFEKKYSFLMSFEKWEYGNFYFDEKNSTGGFGESGNGKQENTTE